MAYCKFESYRGVWYNCLNNNFQYLNTTTRIFITHFNPSVFPQHLNNNIKNL